jgi:hypothetical protein
MNRGSLWVITTFFNPAGYIRRLRNFHVFRRQLKAPLLVVELAQPGYFQLDPDDADAVIRVSGNAHIWQKERLLNIAVGALPNEARYVAWVDCDVVFDNPDWVTEARSLLETGQQFVQLFDTAMHLPPQDTRSLDDITAIRSTTPLFSEQSFVSALISGSYFTERTRLRRSDAETGVSNSDQIPVVHGIAWAGHRHPLQDVGLYDACIIGGGPSAMALASIGRAHTLISKRPMTGMHNDHYLTWARAFENNTMDDVEVAPGTVFHLWHGHYKRRRYQERHMMLKNLAFNPYDDLELAENGTWRWASHATVLQAAVDAYFSGRLEDQV